MSQEFKNSGPIYTTSVKYNALKAEGLLEIGREYRITDYEPQDKLTTGTGINISSDNIISLDSDAAIAIYNDRIADADKWLTNGYTKTSAETPTANLPSVCTGDDRWGVLLYVAENNENKAGVQQYIPIDGTYKGRVFYRSVTGYSAGIDPDFGPWELLPWSSEKQDTLVSGTNIKTINETSLLGSGNISFVEGKLNSTITTTTTVGHVETGTVFNSGTSLEDIVKQIFIGTIPETGADVYVGHVNNKTKQQFRDMTATELLTASSARLKTDSPYIWKPEAETAIVFLMFKTGTNPTGGSLVSGGIVSTYTAENILGTSGTDDDWNLSGANGHADVTIEENTYKVVALHMTSWAINSDVVTVYFE